MLCNASLEAFPGSAKYFLVYLAIWRHLFHLWRERSGEKLVSDLHIIVIGSLSALSAHWGSPMEMQPLAHQTRDNAMDWRFPVVLFLLLDGWEHKGRWECVYSTVQNQNKTQNTRMGSPLTTYLCGFEKPLSLIKPWDTNTFFATLS